MLNKTLVDDIAARMTEAEEKGPALGHSTLARLMQEKEYRQYLDMSTGFLKVHMDALITAGEQSIIGADAKTTMEAYYRMMLDLIDFTIQIANTLFVGDGFLIGPTTTTIEDDIVRWMVDDGCGLISAIKNVRAKFSCGLKEAKDLVEKVRDERLVVLPRSDGTSMYKRK